MELKSWIAAKFETVLLWTAARRKVAVPFLWVFVALWTIGAYQGCESTLVRSPATVSVRGYTRRDGTTVQAYHRRPPGVAAADNRQNARTSWIRLLIFVAWMTGSLGSLLVIFLIVPRHKTAVSGHS